jgi:hypothetical protein
MLPGGETEGARNAGDVVQARIDFGLPADGAAAESGEECIRMRALDDELAARARQLPDHGLIPMTDDAALGLEVLDQPGFELRIDLGPAANAAALE